MAGPATSARDPRARQLVDVRVPRSSLGTMVLNVCGRTPRITRSPSNACKGDGLVTETCMLLGSSLRWGYCAAACHKH